MKKAISVLMSLCLASCLSVAVAAAEPLAEDRNTHGEWVGAYGKDGYVIFNSSVDSFTTLLPEYVQELTYTDLYEANAAPHAWWSGTDGSDLEDPTHAADALWTDETKTFRVAPAIYNGSGLSVTVDTGDVTSTVSLYSVDWDDNGRVMEVNVYDGEGNQLASKEVTDFQKGVYLSTEVTGKAVFEYIYLDATNMDSPSNAVIAGIFFDSAENEAAVVEETVAEEAPVEEVQQAEEPAEEIFVEEPIIEETVAVEATVEAAVEAKAPQTFDIAAGIAIMTGILGMGISIAGKKR